MPILQGGFGYGSKLFSSVSDCGRNFLSSVPSCLSARASGWSLHSSAGPLRCCCRFPSSSNYHGSQIRATSTLRSWDTASVHTLNRTWLYCREFDQQPLLMRRYDWKTDQGLLTNDVSYCPDSSKWVLGVSAGFCADIKLDSPIFAWKKPSRQEYSRSFSDGFSYIWPHQK